MPNLGTMAALGSRKPANSAVGKLAALSREIAGMVDQLTAKDALSSEAMRSSQKAESHLKLAVKHLSAVLTADSDENELFPSLRDTLESILVQKMDPGAAGSEEQDAAVVAPQAAIVETRSCGLHGDAACLSLAELISILAVHRKDGVLNAIFDTEIITVWFEDGDLVHAVSNQPGGSNRLGDILVEIGAIDREQLEAILQDSQGRRGRIGTFLVEHRLIEPEALVKAMQIQVQRLFTRLCGQPRAHYNFSEGLPPGFEHQIRMNVTQLLLDQARISDEFNRR